MYAVSMCICVRACMNVYTSVYVSMVRLYACECMHAYIFASVCIHVYVCVCVYVYLCAGASSYKCVLSIHMCSCEC